MINGDLYRTRPLSTTSFFQRLFKQLPEENVVIELNNILATRPLLDITQKDVEKIEHKYQVNLHRAFSLNLEEFYTVYLNYCLTDKFLSNDELNELNHLKHLLGLDNKAVDMLHVKLGTIIYKKSFQEAVADGRLTKSEEEFLAKLEHALRLPKELAEKISTETRIAHIENYVAGIVADQRLSPAEEQELEAIALSLNINVKLSQQTKEQLRKLKLYWALEHLDLPIIQPDIVIQKSEVCHVSIPHVNWHELRSVRQRSTYSGYATSFRVAKGFYLRSGKQPAPKL